MINNNKDFFILNKACQQLLTDNMFKESKILQTDQFLRIDDVNISNHKQHLLQTIIFKNKKKKLNNEMLQ